MIENTILRKNRKGYKALSFALGFPSAPLVELAAQAGYDALDAILKVRGLTGITGGPHDFAASLGHPGEPDHPERVSLTADAEARARKAGKRVAADLLLMLSIEETMLGLARDFVAKRAAEASGRKRSR